MQLLNDGEIELTSVAVLLNNTNTSIQMDVVWKGKEKKFRTVVWKVEEKDYEANTKKGWCKEKINGFCQICID